MDFDDLVTILWEVDSEYYEKHGEDNTYEALHSSIIQLEEWVYKNDKWEETL